MGAFQAGARASLIAALKPIAQAGRSIHERLLRWVSDSTEVLQDEDEVLEPLPPEVIRSLQAKVKALPNHPRDWCALQSALGDAIGQWQADPENSENAIAVLSNPADTVARLLQADLFQDLEVEVEIHRLQCSDRLGAAKIRERLRQVCKPDLVGQGQPDAKAEGGQGKAQIIVIPKLEHCFLRSVDGLDGIEYLRDKLLGDRSRFWVFGSSSISWQYLTKVCDLDAYCIDSFTLPASAGDELERWLQPVIEALPLPLEFESNSLRGHFAEDEDSEALRQDYFKSLSEKAGGNSLVAADLFVKSLSYSVEAGTEEESQSDKTSQSGNGGETQGAVIKARYPDQPTLPEITPDAEYLLYSILLHNEISLADLAVSLGVSPSEIRSTVQLLRREGVLQRESIQLDNLYFSRVREKLENDNFLI